ncbi:hypothetical protein QF034_008160 [Streptomyces africanus]|uniref:Chromate transporter n=1 Tax=Streptomyces africanus TaxID=231024 RepID=A0ABU0R596_9ACTN|nr:hypothetical protein [Streptomyces africanus]
MRRTIAVNGCGERRDPLDGVDIEFGRLALADESPEGLLQSHLSEAGTQADSQLLGGIWILQTFPALVGGLFTRWFHRSALLAGWAVGMIYGTLAA